MMQNNMNKYIHNKNDTWHAAPTIPIKEIIKRTTPNIIIGCWTTFWHVVWFVLLPNDMDININIAAATNVIKLSNVMKQLLQRNIFVTYLFFFLVLEKEK